MKHFTKRLSAWVTSLADNGPLLFLVVFAFTVFFFIAVDLLA